MRFLGAAVRGDVRLVKSTRAVPFALAGARTLAAREELDGFFDTAVKSAPSQKIVGTVRWL